MSKKYKYISQEFLEESFLNTGGFWNFSFSKLLAVIALKMLPREVSSVANMGLFMSGTMNYDITSILGDVLATLKTTAAEYVKGKKYKCLLKSGVEKNVCISNSYDEVIKELESKKGVCNKTKEKKQNCLDYINKVQQVWRDRKEALVRDN